jgi:HEAT repeat protein
LSGLSRLRIIPASGFSGIHTLLSFGICLTWYIMFKPEIEKLLREKNFDELREVLTKDSRNVRKLMGFLYHPEVSVRDAAAKGFGIVAQIWPFDKLMNLVRRMLWMMNDESGSCTWHIPYALGEIGYNRPEAMKNYMKTFANYVNDPDETLSSGVEEALRRMKEGGLSVEAYRE